MTTKNETFSLKTVRRNCLECSGGSARCVLWCPCDGHNSTKCEFWAFRFGQKPMTFIGKHGPYLLTPEIMPAASADLEGLPANLAEASRWLQERNPQVEWSGPREPDPEKVERGQRAMARLQATQRAARKIDSGAESTGSGPHPTPRKPR